MEPSTQDYAERVRTSFAAQSFMSFLDARLELVEPGYVEIAVPFRPDLTQQHGFFHAGVTMTLADNVAGFAAFSLMRAEKQPLSIEMKINLLSKGQGDRLIARGRVLRQGRRLSVCRSDVFAERDGSPVHCATALVTIIGIEGLEERGAALETDEAV